MPTAQELLDQVHSLHLDRLWDVALLAKERGSLIKLTKQHLKLTLKEIKHEQREINRRWDSRKKSEAEREKSELLPYNVLFIFVEKLFETIAELEYAVEFDHPIPAAPVYGTRLIQHTEGARHSIQIGTEQEEADLKRARIKDLLNRAAEFIKAKNYAAARPLLADIDHPRAREWLEKIDSQIAKEEAAKPIVVNTPKTSPAIQKPKRQPAPPPAKPSAAPIFFGTVIAMGLIIGLYILLQPVSPFASQQPSGPTPTLDMTARMSGTTTRDYMKQACQTAFYHQRGSLTPEQYETGCDLEGNRLIATYPAAISYCVENDVNSLGMFMDCLKRRQVGFLFSTVTNLPTAAPDAVGEPPAVPAFAYDSNGSDRDCSDFGTHADAQAFFVAAGGPASDPHQLDGDYDGIACERLP
jgi:hypothetical protein